MAYDLLITLPMTYSIDEITEGSRVSETDAARAAIRGLMARLRATMRRCLRYLSVLEEDGR